ncbi:hypothetical protein [Flammeovirga kamogawensis]|uniref:Uncharacterized protein n=1 Tax=Flammeovirga kamogawensis TaxID=373891 RepID=A0ABX8H200_9BACT|nr:hypothetical protein [Flammeovirga kamogawensis]MBB6464093.1 hypothetical protein [Flammeovirga kamogawensis]QWG09928.1 hypothetical protein KM029_19800 [Flammeovirga kamogawensis]TRX65438.1 hypothetical protein EO216_23225 [Flammeovirga kamogawensis]
MIRITKYIFTFSFSVLSIIYFSSFNQRTLQNDKFDLNDIFLNDSIKVKLSLDDLLSKCGQPDTIYTDNSWECGNYINQNESVEIYSYKKTDFIVSEGKALLYKYRPSESNFHFGNQHFKIDSKSNESYLEKIFPNSYNSMLERLDNNSVSDRKMRVDFKTKYEHTEPAGYIFYLKNNKIKEIVYWAFIC